MLNMDVDVENQLLDSLPNGFASEQEIEPVQTISPNPPSMGIEIVELEEATEAHVKSTRQKISLPAQCKSKKAIIGIFSLIFCPVLFFLGTLVPLRYQQDTIKCPPEWIGHQGHCYYFSAEEKNWNESQNFCILHNAFLAKITKEEMAFVTMLTRNHVRWIGLKREPGQPWKWLDGENSTLEVMGNGGDCAYLDDGATANSGRCTTEHHYICKKN